MHLRTFILFSCVLTWLAILPRQHSLAQAEQGGTKHSRLWGKDGELWTPQSRLPDFSFAGYRSSNVSIPDIPVASSVVQFGAKGDGVTDDTSAILKAIEDTPKGAIFLPEGRYLMTQPLVLTRSKLVLRGAGPEKTVLVIPKSLTQVMPVDPKKGNFPWSFGGGFVSAKGETTGQKVAEVAAPGLRGDRKLELSVPPALKAGDYLRLTLSDLTPSLGRHLHADLADAGGDTYKALRGRNWVDWAARVEKVQGKTVFLDRPLRLDVRMEWKPEVWSCQPTLSEVGVENLAFEFAGVPKLGHLREEGFNAVHFSGVWNSWVRNVLISDADLGVMLAGFSRFCTVENIRFNALKRTRETGHHGLWATGGTQDCLFAGFRFETNYMHDLTVEGRANGNVFRDGSGISLNFDHHRNAPYENLFTNLDVGDGKRVWKSSGRADRGPHSGARPTFWNLRASRPIPPAPDWPQINVVGVPNQAVLMTETNAWIEPIEDLQPPDLYLAQLRRRLLALPQPADR